MSVKQTAKGKIPAQIAREVDSHKCLKCGGCIDGEDRLDLRCINCGWRGQRERPPNAQKHGNATNSIARIVEPTAARQVRKGPKSKKPLQLASLPHWENMPSFISRVDLSPSPFLLSK